MAFWSESDQKIFIDGSKVHSVIKRKQDSSDYQVTEKIPNDDLHITELTAVNPARYRYKGNP